MSTNYQPAGYIAPPSDVLPKEFKPLLDRLEVLRTRWAEATEQANNARRALREAPAQYADAVRAAAARGEDVTAVPDVRVTAREEYEVRDLAERGLAAEVWACWAEVWNMVSNNFDQVLAFVDKPAEAATQKVADLEAQLASARADLAQALGNRRWVVSRRKPTDHDGARRRAARPQPMTDADSGTLARLRAEEAKAQALADQQEAAHAASIERQKREAEREQRRLEERKARRAAARS